LEHIKTCTTCGFSKNVKLFYKNKCKKDGLANVCKECQSKYEKSYVERNSDKVRATKLKYTNARRHDDPLFKLAHALRRRLTSAIKRGQKSGSAVDDLGCSVEEFKLYIESKFQPGMTWENYTYHGWHLDHIVPLSAFDLSSPEEFKRACHYTNIQPLWKLANLSKSDKILAILNG
jgi:hypothetical protein